MPVFGVEDTVRAASCVMVTAKSASKLMLLGHLARTCRQSNTTGLGIGVAIETMASAIVVKTGTHAFARTMTIRSGEHPGLPGGCGTFQLLAPDAAQVRAVVIYFRESV